jgi:hypothetical protein
MANNPSPVLSLNNLIDEATGLTNRAVLRGLVHRLAMADYGELSPRAIRSAQRYYGPLLAQRLSGWRQRNGKPVAMVTVTAFDAPREGGVRAMQPNKQRVPARYLLAGDRLCTGETIVAVSRGARTPSGKVEVTLEKDGRRRTPLWGASTTINISRAPDPVAGKVAALGALLSELSAVALDADRAALLAPHIDALCSGLAKYQFICACIAEPRKESRPEQ